MLQLLGEVVGTTNNLSSSWNRPDLKCTIIASKETAEDGQTSSPLRLRLIQLNG